MKFFATILAVIASLAVASASGYGGGASASASGYGGSSIPAPPCPKNYLFSCQPNLAPAPCAPPAASYGSAGAYSESVPTIVNAPYGYQGYPQNLLQVPSYYGNH